MRRLLPVAPSLIKRTDQSCGCVLLTDDTPVIINDADVSAFVANICGIERCPAHQAEWDKGLRAFTDRMDADAVQHLYRTLGACIVAVLLLPLLACGGHSPIGPTPPPPPQIIHINGTLTDTVSGASVGSFAMDVPSLPARVTVTASGFLSRETWVSSATPTMDLIRNAPPFDLGFYRQLVRNGYESPNALDASRVLAAAPSIYLQRTGLTDANVVALEAAARAVVPALTGHLFQVVAFESGNELRSDMNGWIIVELVNEPGGTSCGRANVGLRAGHAWLNIAARCAFNGQTIDPGTLAHEVGHAVGFWHTEAGPLMKAGRIRGTLNPSDAERYHASIAYHRVAGNLDVDIDPISSPSARATRQRLISD